ncbi:MAG TPA: hypothetical protein VJ719_09125 [Chthoniobacterales bacterium]|nr:hypothetical protein [Chthoniobacterales bacterium]
MKRLLIISITIVVALSASSASAREQTILARITVYWPTGSERPVASYNGARLRTGHCAVDPNKIPYGSKVIFPDTACVAVDCGPAVTRRTAARRSGKTTEQRNALVIDRFFESKQQAMAWVAKNPHFMKVRVLDPHHRTADASASEPSTGRGVESAQSQPTKTYSPDGTVLPGHAQDPLNPMSSGAVLPRS